ncbi:Origin recognition complex subunit 2 [Microbotryomycetes sp. JL201]|nr:Origin recognition complex subunit 2 [Microbotryomycetes sp. JL201]
MTARTRARAGSASPSKSKSSSQNGDPPSTKRRKTVKGNQEQGRPRRVAIRTRTVNVNDEDQEDEEEDQDRQESDRDEYASEDGVQHNEAGPSRFVTESLGDAYLLQANTTSKTSDNLLSSVFDQEFTFESYEASLQAFDDLPELAQRRSAFATRLEKLAHTKFDSWLWEMEQGFNVMLHGFGSKRQVLDRFAEKARSRGHVVVVKGYDPESSLVDIASAIEDVIAQESQDMRRTSERSPSKASTKGKSKADTNTLTVATLPSATTVLESRFRKLVVALHNRQTKKVPIYLVVHNIDGPTLRQAKHLVLLALLSAQPSVHLITTVDHIRAGMLFPASMTMTRPHHLSLTTSAPANSISVESLFDVRSFNFVYHACPTFTPYTEEALLSNVLSKLLPSAVFPSLSSSLDPTSASLSQSALHVLASVTDRSRNVFTLLVKLQIDKFDEVDADETERTATAANGGEHVGRINLLPAQGQPAPQVAMRLDQFKTVATDRLLAANQDQVDGLLAEFRDHNIVQGSQVAPVKRTSDADEEGEADEDDDGGEWIWIPMAKPVLEHLLEQIESGAA